MSAGGSQKRGGGVGDAKTAEVTDRRVALRTLPWIAWSVLFAILAIPLHELGHYVAAIGVGSASPRIHYSWTDPGNLSIARASATGIVGLAGPAVTILLSAFACAWVLLHGPQRWAFALAVAAVSRFIVAVPYTLINVVVRLLGRGMRPPAFDEYKAGVALGVSGNALLASTVLVLVAVLVFVAIKLPRGQRAVAWTGLITGTALGWILWMFVLGPVVLP
jgi:hypothetical protein